MEGFKSLPRRANLTHFTVSQIGMLPKCTFRSSKCTSFVVPHCLNKSLSTPWAWGRAEGRGERPSNCQISFCSVEEMCFFFCFFPFLLLTFSFSSQGKAAHHSPGPRLLVENRTQKVMRAAISKFSQGLNDAKLVPFWIHRVKRIHNYRHCICIK